MVPLERLVPVFHRSRTNCCNRRSSVGYYVSTHLQAAVINDSFWLRIRGPSSASDEFRCELAFLPVSVSRRMRIALDGPHHMSRYDYVRQIEYLWIASVAPNRLKVRHNRTKPR